MLSKTRFFVQTATGLSFNMTRGGANATNGSVAALVRLEVRGPGILYCTPGILSLEHTRPGNYLVQIDRPACDDRLTWESAGIAIR